MIVSQSISFPVLLLSIHCAAVNTVSQEKVEFDLVERRLFLLLLLLLLLYRVLISKRGERKNREN